MPSNGSSCGYKYWTLGNDMHQEEGLVSVFVEEGGWEIYGYSNYDSTGWPSKVELRKRVNRA